MIEIWKDIPSVRDCQISSYGRVKRLAFTTTYMRNGSEVISHFPETILKPTKNKNGYLAVNLIIAETGKQKRLYIHRLVAEAFIPNPDNLPCVNHKNEDKTDNFVWINDDGSADFEKSNLEWCTQKYNCNYGTGKQRARETEIKNGFWADYSNLSAEEKEELEKTRKDKYRAHRKDYYEKKKDWYREYSKTYYSTKVKGVVPYDKEKRKEKYEANKEKILARQREYDRTHYIHKKKKIS